MKKCTYCLLLLLINILYSSYSRAQVKTDTLLPNTASLQQCINYALRNQPQTRQATIDEQINERNIGIALADWLPQINLTGNAQHYFQLPQSYFPSFTDPNAPGSFRSTGLANNSTFSLQGNQVIYNSTVALAARTARYSREYYRENKLSTQINVVAEVSKAFYDVLLSQRQLSIINENITRLQRSIKDAYAQYQAGIVDKIDYKQATIALNNELSSRKQAEEAINSKTAYLKQLMGLSPPKPLQLAYDSTKLEQEINVDTTQMLNVDNRVEYRQLETQRTLQDLNVSYYRWSWLPSVGAFGDYNLAYFNQSATSLYSRSFPNSLVGLNFTVPIFTGTKRLQNLSKARLQVARANLDIVNSRNTINTEYTQALAAYKSNYNELVLQRQNVDMARDVYNVVSLQYREGIKTYLNVITAQSDLRTSQLNYYNSLFNVLESKVDLQKALGNLPLQY
jgi:outer membrane protein TolC